MASTDQGPLTEKAPRVLSVYTEGSPRADGRRHVVRVGVAREIAEGEFDVTLAAVPIGGRLLIRADPPAPPPGTSGK